MANPVTPITLGVDVSKDELVVCQFDDPVPVQRIDNEPDAIRTWLAGYTDAVRIAVEPTSTYHLAVVEAALDRGMWVYLINPRQLVHYREAVNEINKTDPIDAYLLARYVAREADQLRPFQPRDRKAQQLWSLMKRRGVVVRCRQRLSQSLGGIDLPSGALFRQIEQTLKRIDTRIQQLLRAVGWWDDYQRCLSMPGIGAQNAAALTIAYHRGAFGGVDRFISYLGLDVRIRESGRFRGRRKLTKRGEAEIRRLLYCAAKPARCHPRFAEYHQRQLDKGLPKIAANVILARKLARIAYALISKQQTFNRDI